MCLESVAVSLLKALKQGCCARCFLALSQEVALKGWNCCCSCNSSQATFWSILYDKIGLSRHSYCLPKVLEPDSIQSHIYMIEILLSVISTIFYGDSVPVLYALLSSLIVAWTWSWREVYFSFNTHVRLIIWTRMYTINLYQTEPSFLVFVTLFPILTHPNFSVHVLVMDARD